MADDLPEDPFPADVPEELGDLAPIWQDAAVTFQQAHLDLHAMVNQESLGNLWRAAFAIEDNLRTRFALIQAATAIRRSNMTPDEFARWNVME